MLVVIATFINKGVLFYYNVIRRRGSCDRTISYSPQFDEEKPKTIIILHTRMGHPCNGRVWLHRHATRGYSDIFMIRIACLSSFTNPQSFIHNVTAAWSVVTCILFEHAHYYLLISHPCVCNIIVYEKNLIFILYYNKCIRVDWNYNLFVPMNKHLLPIIFNNIQSDKILCHKNGIGITHTFSTSFQ